MRHMLAGDNLGLITCRQQSEAGLKWNRCGVTRTILDECTISNKTREINYLYPLYIYPSEQEIKQGLYSAGDREPNFAPRFTGTLEYRLGLRFVRDGNGDLEQTFGPEDILQYIYAIFYSTGYRERYDEFLRADFPRVPLPDSTEMFGVLAGLGRRLMDAHLLTSSEQPESPVGFPIVGNNIVENGHPKYYPPGQKPPGGKSPIERGRVYISRDIGRSGRRGQYFEGITPEVVGATSWWIPADGQVAEGPQGQDTHLQRPRPLPAHCCGIRGGNIRDRRS